MSIIPTVQNQQSVVRTDFTLKYYMLDELLKKSSLLKIVGSESQVFVRSWLDFSLVRGDLIVPWLSGDLSVVLKTLSHVLKQFVANIADLVAFIKASESGIKLIFAVNVAQVKHSDFCTLVDALKDIHYQNDDTTKSVQAENSLPNCVIELDQSDTDEFALQAKKIIQSTEASSYCASIVIWHPQSQLAFSKYQHWLSDFSIALDLGDSKDAQINQALLQSAFSLTNAIQLKSAISPKTIIPLTVVLLFVVSLSGWFYLEPYSGNLSVAQKIRSLLPTEDTKAEFNLVILQVTNLKSQVASDFNRLESSEDYRTLSHEVILNETLDSQNALTAISDLSQLRTPQTVNQDQKVSILQEGSATLQPTAMSSTLADMTVEKRKALKATALDSITISSPFAVMAVKHNVLLDANSPNKQRATANFGKKSIVENYSGGVVNTASSINPSPKNLHGHVLITESAADGQTKSNSQVIEKQIDKLLSAWQAKDFLSYSQVYSKDFKGDRSSHQSWMDWRKQRIESPKWVKLSRSDIKHLKLLGEQYVITFTLSYASPNYADDTLKRMTFTKTATSFKIIREENLTVQRVR